MGLPTLATASDVREVVQYLKKKPAGVTMVQAMDAVQKRVFDPRKVAAYEFWGIVVREGDRLKLSPLGWEFARKLAPEADAYRAVLDNASAYKSVLEWIHRENRELVTHTDVAAYWQEHHPDAVTHHDEKMLEANVVCFFHLCQAAELGTVTIGKRGQPARLRIDHDELRSYIEAARPLLQDDEGSAEKDMKKNERYHTALTPTSTTAPPSKTPLAEDDRLRVFISCGRDMEIVQRIEATLDLADIESQVSLRTESETAPVAKDVFQSMRQCNAGLIVVTADDYRKDCTGEYVLKENILVEIGTAFVLYDRRVVLLWDQQMPVPGKFSEMYQCKFAGDDLTWSAGVQIMKAVKDFKHGVRLS